MSREKFYKDFNPDQTFPLINFLKKILTKPKLLLLITILGLFLFISKNLNSNSIKKTPFIKKRNDIVNSALVSKYETEGGQLVAISQILTRTNTKIVVDNPNILSLVQKMSNFANILYCYRSKGSVHSSNSLEGTMADYLAFPKSRELIAYFRGQEMSVEQWKNRKTDLVPYKNVPGALVDSIWASNSLTIEEKLESKILKVVKDYEGEGGTVYLTGHGIGGAYAVLVALRLLEAYEEAKDRPSAQINVKFAAISFGQPRLGNKRFVEYLNQKLTVYRVTNMDDYFPHFPNSNESELSEPMVHHDTEYWISDDCDCTNEGSNNDELQLYVCSQVKNGEENFECNLGTKGLNIRAHYGPYFGTTFRDCSKSGSKNKKFFP